DARRSDHRPGRRGGRFGDQPCLQGRGRLRHPDRGPAAAAAGHPLRGRHGQGGGGMSDATQFYLSTLLIYLFIDIMGVLGLNLQFGVAGIINFAYIVFVAVGAYTAAVLSLGPDYPDNFQHYVFGASLPFPLPIIAAGATSGLLSLVV